MTAPRPILIGENNPYGDVDEFALYPSPKGCAGWRLCHLVLQMDPDAYVEAFERVNLLAGPWRKLAASLAAAKMRERFPSATLVLLGARVQAAFGYPFEPFTVREQDGHKLVLLPHPSGLARAWGVPGAFERAREVLRSASVLPVAGETAA